MAGCIYTYGRGCTPACICMYIYVYTYMRPGAHPSMYIYIYICIYVCVYMAGAHPGCIYTYGRGRTPACMYMYIYMYIYMWPGQPGLHLYEATACCACMLHLYVAPLCCTQAKSSISTIVLVNIICSTVFSTITSATHPHGHEYCASTTHQHQHWHLLPPHRARRVRIELDNGFPSFPPQWWIKSGMDEVRDRVRVVLQEWHARGQVPTMAYCFTWNGILFHMEFRCGVR